MRNLFFLLFLITSTFTFAQNVDLSSVDEFFKITDKLKNGEEISDNDWNNFEKSKAIVIDLNLIYKMTEQQRIDFIAHEFFHVYRSHFENHDFNYANDIYFALDMIANEGIADQIDKYNMDYEQYYSTVIGSQELKDEFINLYENAEKDIEYLQDIIVQYSKNQIDKETCIDKLLEIYKYNGHALGFYMSNQIIMAGLKDEMIKEFYKPYEFYRLYSLALYKNKGISLNDDFLGFLKEATGELD